MKRITALLLAACVAALLNVTPARAAIEVSNWNISGNTLSFAITGEIDPGANIGGSQIYSFFIGEPGNTAWVLGDSTSLTIVNQGTGHRLINTGAGIYHDFVIGDYVQLYTAGFVAWEVGDSVDALVTLSGGTLDGSKIDPAQIIVSAGYNTFTTFPDPATQVGGYAVPEPSTYAALLGLGALALVALRSRKRKLLECA